MSISKAIQNLSNAFEEAARAIESEMPDLWLRAGEIIPDEKDRVTFFTQPTIGFGGKSLIEIAGRENGKQAVMNHIGHNEYGGFA